jgi:thiamine pyrophosphate-dependent enzyme
MRPAARTVNQQPERRDASPKEGDVETVRLTMAQAVVRFLAAQHVERDGREDRFFAGVWGIFGHGNVAGIGQALEEYSDLIRYYRPQNEQGMVHAAAAYAKMKNRLQAFACTSSIGPGATNMVTGAATATVNRLPVLLLPGDIFASRNSNIRSASTSASTTASSPCRNSGIGSTGRTRFLPVCRRRCAS